ncbi:MAG: hypothetical protein E7290_09290 [Lachnospiraceae bacterium]|nr:hypothetical protein [Lachnospiraceae bacterium]
MELYQILYLLGVPSISVAIIGAISRKVKKASNDTEALKLGIQALLRAQMISEYNKWSERGYAPIYARENFENCWQQYHSLGANGVMDDIHNKFLALPTQEQG